ncbi:hypothetical protein GQ44DRAFT_792334 [Phaeosphaeriaceae sp. PMI808]|nr:hypothetical protein GQ44DRAFT_792334 [Phaeosphaeriaceae sp. PMI808]
MSRSILVAAQTETPDLAVDNVADFNQTVEVLGQMQRTDQDFKDGLALDLFSPLPRTLVVRKNTTPLPPQFVTGASGEPFIALSDYSYIIKMNETAKDLVAKIEIPHDPVKVRSTGVDVANTYVAKLAPDGLSWKVSELQRNVHVSENNTRIIKLTELDGEYMLLGRKTVDSANIFVQYGFGATRTVNLTGGKGEQEAQFVDGLRILAIADKAMGINIDLKAGVDKAEMPADMRSLNSYAWVMNTSMPNQSLKNGTISFPVNTNLMHAGTNLGKLKLAVGKRSLNSTIATAFDTIKNTSEMKTRIVTKDSERIVQISGMTRLDGEYVLLVPVSARKEVKAEVGAVKKDAIGDKKSSTNKLEPRELLTSFFILTIFVLGIL